MVVTVKEEKKATRKRRNDPKETKLQRTKKHMSLQSSASYAEVRMGPVALSMYPLPCVCDPKDKTPAIAYHHTREEHKVEAGLYGTRVKLNQHQESKYYKAYGQCVFCQAGLWDIHYVKDSYKKELEEERQKDARS